MFTVDVCKTRAEQPRSAEKRRVGHPFNSSTPPPPHCLTAPVGPVFARFTAIPETASVQQQEVHRLVARPAPLRLAVVRLLSRPDFTTEA